MATRHWCRHWQRYCMHQTISAGHPGELPVSRQALGGSSRAWLVSFPANRVPIDTSADLLGQPFPTGTFSFEAREIQGNLSRSTTTLPAQSQCSGSMAGRSASVATHRHSAPRDCRSPTVPDAGSRVVHEQAGWIGKRASAWGGDGTQIVQEAPGEIQS